MTEPLFSDRKARRPYRPEGYSEKTALENEPDQEEGLFGDEFEGEITNDPLEDLVDHNWAVDPNEDQVVNFEDEPTVDFEDEYEREETITNTASRTSYKGFPYNNLQEQPFLPGHKWPTYLYRGLTVKMPSDMEGELDLAVMEGDQREIYRIGKKVLNIISSKGMGRHWTTEPDIAMDFAQRSAPNGNLAVVLSVVWERDGEDLAAEHEGYDGVVRPSRLVGEEEVTLERGTRIKVISMKASRVGGGTLYERDFSLDLLDTPQTKTASQLVANDGVLDSLNPTGTIFTEYNPQGRASLDLAPNIAPYSETSGMSPDDRVVVYRGVPKGVQSELADGDFITDMEQLAKDYAGYPYGDVISQEVFADEILDDLEYPMSGEYLFRPRRASKKTTNRKKEQMSAVRNYLRFAKRRGMDPKNPRTSRSYQRSSRRLSRRAMADISSWMGAQRTAAKTAQRVLNNTRSYRRKMASGSWYLDNKLSAYVSKTPQRFACSCGSHISVPSYTNCKCGKVWNAYKIHSATKGDTTFVVREVPVRENVLVANRRRVASPRDFGESYLQGQGWSSMDTGRTTWDSPSGNVSYFGNDNLVHVWNRDGDLVDDFTVDPRLAPDELAGILQETEESAARTSPWYVDNDPIEHPGADADYMHPYFN